MEENGGEKWCTGERMDVLEDSSAWDRPNPAVCSCLQEEYAAGDDETLTKDGCYKNRVRFYTLQQNYGGAPKSAERSTYAPVVGQPVVSGEWYRRASSHRVGVMQGLCRAGEVDANA